MSEKRNVRKLILKPIVIFSLAFLAYGLLSVFFYR